MPIVSILGRLKQDCCEFETSLGYIMGSSQSRLNYPIDEEEEEDNKRHSKQRTGRGRRKTLDSK